MATVFSFTKLSVRPEATSAKPTSPPSWKSPLSRRHSNLCQSLCVCTLLVWTKSRGLYFGLHLYTHSEKKIPQGLYCSKKYSVILEWKTTCLLLRKGTETDSQKNLTSGQTNKVTPRGNTGGYYYTSLSNFYKDTLPFLQRSLNTRWSTLLIRCNFLQGTTAPVILKGEHGRIVTHCPGLKPSLKDFSIHGCRNCQSRWKFFFFPRSKRKNISK